MTLKGNPISPSQFEICLVTTISCKDLNLFIPKHIIGFSHTVRTTILTSYLHRHENFMSIKYKIMRQELSNLGITKDTKIASLT